MSIATIFQDFSDSLPSTARANGKQSDPLEGYESGYQSGWDDAVSAHQDSHTHLSTTLEQNLERIEFTLLEAQAQLLTSIKPVLAEVTNTLLPGLANEALRALLNEEVSNLLKFNLAADISIVVSEQDETTVAAFLNTSRKLSDVSLVAKETISEGQAYVSCTNVQRKIDITQALSEIQATLDSFLNQPELEQVNDR